MVVIEIPPNRGFYNRMLTDNDVERKFALGADLDDEIICLMKR
jgi:type III restriction enzyme